MSAAQHASKVLFCCPWASADDWKRGLADAGMPLKVWPTEESLDDVVFAVCWQPPQGLLSRCRNLRAIQSLGAGVDHLFKHANDLPAGVAVLRVVDPLMSQRMATWVMWAVINTQRRMDDYAAAQRDCVWGKHVENFRTWDNAEVRVGIMGGGVMGKAAADMLTAAAYNVRMWTRSHRAHAADGGDNIQRFQGKEQLKEFVAGCDMLVCLLPLTPETRGIISASLLSWLPRGATVINAARGAHLIESDLLAALDSGHLSGAVLDVFQTEPLPHDSPLWLHPKVRLTPHVSAMTNIDTAVQQMVENYHCVLQHKELPAHLLVDVARGD